MRDGRGLLRFPHRLDNGYVPNLNGPDNGGRAVLLDELGCLDQDDGGMSGVGHFVIIVRAEGVALSG